MDDFNEIPSDSMTLGTRFSQAVFFDDKKNMFLLENTPLKQYHLDAIKWWNIKTFFSKGQRIEDVPQI